MIAELMRNSKVFLSTARYEGNPKVILEAMFCKLLVISRDKPGISNLIQNNKTGYLLAEHDEEYNKRLILRSIREPHINRVIVENAYSQAYSENSLQRILNDELSLYD